MNDTFAGDALGDERALVTGGARGIGEAITRQLAAMGAEVLIADRDIDLATAVAQDIVGQGGRASAHEIDLADRSGLVSFCEAIDPIDILVNNAAPRQANGPFLDMPDSDWEEQFAILLWAPLVLIRDIGRRMAERGHGSIVNIISTASQRPAPFTAPYGAAKAAMEVVTKVTALELGPRGVRCNGVSPSFVPTERNRTVWERVGFSENSGRANPMGRIATPADVAGTVAWLLSSAAGYGNGQVIIVDGGASAGVFIPPPAPASA
jgi:NAD(P)-dependent dehydrogenase (short-subunit alcohol dehydrogenase family)